MRIEIRADGAHISGYHTLAPELRVLSVFAFLFQYQCILFLNSRFLSAGVDSLQQDLLLLACRALASDLSAFHRLHRLGYGVLSKVSLHLLPDRCAPELERQVLKSHTFRMLHESSNFYRKFV